MPVTAMEFPLHGPLHPPNFIPCTGADFATRVQWYDPGGRRAWENRQRGDHRKPTRHPAFYYLSEPPLTAIRRPGTWRVELDLDDELAGE